jgi:hypothetical protein
MKKRNKVLNIVTLLAALIVALPATLVAAANPPEPTYIDELNGILPPTVDGLTGDWDPTLDHFAYMYLAGGNGGQTDELAKLYLRYDCGSGYLYALVLTKAGVTIDADGNPDEHYIKFGNGQKLVDANDAPPDGNPPDFAWVGLNADGTTALGWEASAFVPQGYYNNLNVHTNVNFSGVQTAQVLDGSIDLDLTCDTPTAVDLARFEARAEGRAIVLEWETVSEVDNLGFNLYRAESEAGSRVQLNAGLIPSQALGSPLGAVYQFRDETALPGTTYYYWLEDVDIYGQSTYHGPVTAAFKLYNRVLPGEPKQVPAPVVQPARPQPQPMPMPMPVPGRPARP